MPRIKCPVCGCKMVLKAYPTNLGYEAQCVNKDCEAWGHKFDYEGLKRSMADSIGSIGKKLITVIPGMVCGTLYKCSVCEREHRSNWRLIHHKKNCAVGRYIRTHN